MSVDRRTRERVAEVRWMRNFEILPGLRTRTEHGVVEEDRLPLFGIPDDLSGRRVLDVGCCDGFFSFLAESRGADVVAVDLWPHRGFFLARELRRSRVAFRRASVYEIVREGFGEFDVVFFFGVYYHLKHPLLALERLAEVTRDLLLVESEITPGGAGAPPVARFFEHDELAGDATNWWAPTVPGLLATVRAGGFPRAELVSTYGNRAIVRATKGPETACRKLDEEILLEVDPVVPSADGSAWIVSGRAIDFRRPASGVERVVVDLARLDAPGARLGRAELGLRRPEIEASHGAADAFSGFRLEIPRERLPSGAHELHVLAIGRGGWRSRSVFVPAGGPAGGERRER